MRQSIVLTLCLMTASSLAQKPKPAEDCYNNSRYSYAFCYPVKLLKPQGESGSRDGQTFKIAGSKGTVAVWREFASNDPDGKPTPLAETMKDATEAARSDGYTVSYSLLKPTFFVLSGAGKGMILYQRTIQRDDLTVTVRYQYPESMKAVINKLIHDTDIVSILPEPED
ncbi:hypothetical protein [Granulicella arctica]|uniref:hypothetical protein n=1 Tax=Granulicella arctica TaxID=940613 RepID=UPI0021DF7C7C|nr:hypothetical protein [Granulicella arctica]